MNVRQLRYFLAVAREGSIARAAKSIHISQPSISVQVKALESELGVPLFERSTEGVVLTPEGNELLLHAKGVVAALEAARASVRNLRWAAEGPVGVGIPGSLAGLLTASLVERVAASYPAIQLRVVGGLSGHTRAWILDGRLDLGLVYDASEVPDLHMEPLFRERLYLVAPAGSNLAKRQRGKLTPIPLNKLAALPMVLPGPGYAIRGIVESAAEAVGARLNVAAEVDAIDQMIEVVARIGYCSVMSIAALHGSQWESQVVAIPIGAPSIERRVSLAHAKHRPLSIAAREVQKVFQDLVLEKTREPWWAASIATLAAASSPSPGTSPDPPPPPPRPGRSPHAAAPGRSRR